VEKHLSIVLVDNRHHREIARTNWGLTKQQMKGKHVHHRIKRSDGGTNDPTNLYVCSDWFHNNVWHSEEEFLEWAKKGGQANKGVRKTQRGSKRMGRPPGTKDSVQTRARKSEARKGSKNPRYGVTLSEDTRQKISGSKKGRKHTQKEKENHSKEMTGRKWWVSKDGRTKFCRDCPGDGWVLGRVKPS
jgi:hypothetical protein